MESKQVMLVHDIFERGKEIEQKRGMEKEGKARKMQLKQELHNVAFHEVFMVLFMSLLLELVTMGLMLGFDNNQSKQIATLEKILLETSVFKGRL